MGGSAGPGVRMQGERILVSTPPASPNPRTLYLCSLASYDPVANAVYVPAMQAIEAARLRFEARAVERRRAAAAAANGSRAEAVAVQSPSQRIVGNAAKPAQWVYAPLKQVLPSQQQEASAAAPLAGLSQPSQRRLPVHPALSRQPSLRSGVHGQTFYPAPSAVGFCRQGATVLGGTAPLPAAALGMPGMEFLAEAAALDPPIHDLEKGGGGGDDHRGAHECPTAASPSAGLVATGAALHEEDQGLFVPENLVIEEDVIGEPEEHGPASPTSPGWATGDRLASPGFGDDEAGGGHFDDNSDVCTSPRREVNAELSAARAELVISMSPVSPPAALPAAVAHTQVVTASASPSATATVPSASADDVIAASPPLSQADTLYVPSLVDVGAGVSPATATAPLRLVSLQAPTEDTHGGSDGRPGASVDASVAVPAHPRIVNVQPSARGGERLPPEGPTLTRAIRPGAMQVPVRDTRGSDALHSAGEGADGDALPDMPAASLEMEAGRPPSPHAPPSTLGSPHAASRSVTSASRAFISSGIGSLQLADVPEPVPVHRVASRAMKHASPMERGAALLSDGGDSDNFPVRPATSGVTLRSPHDTLPTRPVTSGGGIGVRRGLAGVLAARENLPGQPPEAE